MIQFKSFQFYTIFNFYNLFDVFILDRFLNTKIRVFLQFCHQKLEEQQTPNIQLLNPVTTTLRSHQTPTASRIFVFVLQPFLLLQSTVSLSLSLSLSLFEFSNFRTQIAYFSCCNCHCLSSLMMMIMFILCFCSSI